MIILPLKSKPGIKRDGTMIEGDIYTDGQWVRFVNALPRKIGGIKSLSNALAGNPVSMRSDSKDSYTYVHCGGAVALEQIMLDKDGTYINYADRTPSTYIASSNAVWSMDVMYDASDQGAKLIAQVAPNRTSIYNSEGGKLYYGDLYSTDPLVEITLPAGASITGGVVILHPFLMFYGSYGVVGWSDAGDPTNYSPTGESLAGISRVTGSKVVKGLPFRGGQGPVGLLWSTDSLILASFSGSPSEFSFNTISSQISVMSPNSIIEFEGSFYWMGVNKFFVFNGVVKELINMNNADYLFNNINREASQITFCFTVPRYGEIWWCYPRGNDTECNHAIIYNVREGTWYDTELPTDLRYAAFSPYFATALSLDGKYIYIHEKGYDFVKGSTISPIKSWFTTSDFSFALQQQSQFAEGAPQAANKNTGVRCTAIEPDFLQTGVLECAIIGLNNPKDEPIATQTFTILENPPTKFQNRVPFKIQHRYMHFRLESNVQGGYYQMGQPLIYYDVGDGRLL